MNNRKLSITILLVLSLSVVGFFGFINLAAAKPESGVHLLEEMALMDLTHENFVGSDLSEEPITGVNPANTPLEEGDEEDIWCSDDGLGIDYLQTFVVLSESTHSLILIEKEAFLAYDEVTDEYVFPNPAGIWRAEDRISTADLAYMADEFDNTIYPTVTTIYGEPLPRGDDGQKVWILIFNIRDNTYYPTPPGDPAPTSYIAGYFSSSTSAKEDANIIHIDSYNWEDRVGPGVDRPYLYEGVIAHEFEHLVHFDIDPDEPSWVDEGLADLSGFLCGYGHSSGHIMYYFAYHAFTSLTFWGGGLEDYGASYLFQLYLFEKFGGIDFVKDLVQEQANGIEGIVKTLKKHKVKYSFDDIFDWWTIANYLDDTSIRGGMYGYDLLEMGSSDTNGWTLDWSIGTWWGEPIFGEGNHWYWGDYWADNEWELEGWWGVPQPYTAHYYRFTTDDKSKMYIDGEDFAGTTAYSGTYEWYSGAEAWTWRSFYQTFDIPAGGATLEFMTYFEIEMDWDYGYVEVYDHDDDEWFTLNDPLVEMYNDDGVLVPMVDYIAHAQDNPNTPDGREPTAYEAASRWHAFTGNSGGWIPVSMDLSPFAGHSIDLYFTLWQDGAFTLQNMYVDDIEIPELGFYDDVEGGEGVWSTDGWIVTDGILDNGFEVTIVTLDYPVINLVPMDFVKVNHMSVSHGTQTGVKGLRTSEEDQVYLAIVTNRADHILTSGYVLAVEHMSEK